jgi:predicted secreted hydrolase
MALPGYAYQFPEDHGVHPTYKTEWWYYTGHLNAKPNTPQQHAFGYELTFFRTALTPPTATATLPSLTAWMPQSFVLAHFALTDVGQDSFVYQSKFDRVNPYKTAFTAKPFGVALSNWQLTTVGFVNHGKDPIVRLQASIPEGTKSPQPVAIDLTLTPAKPIVIHGKNGVSQKANCKGCASHYYSYTRLVTVGTVSQGNTATPVVGSSWMDHEFGSNQLTPNQVGWDWMAIQLSDGSELMLYLLRQATPKGGLDPNSAATWVSATGQTEHLKLGAFTLKATETWKSSKSGGVYPSKWVLTIPSKHLSLTLSPKVKAQELVFPTQVGLTYWEGACSVAGVMGKKAVTGNAYTEMTGYTAPFQQKI